MTPEFTVAGEKLHVVTTVEEKRPDLIANRSLGNSEMWWIIMAYNGVKDPFTLLGGDNLRVPQIASRGKFKKLFVDPEQFDIVRDFAVPVPPSLLSVVAVEADVEAIGAEGSNVLHLFNFEVPGCLVGRVHFELQLAIDPEYRDILLGRMSATSLDRWFTFNQGSYQSWPASGLDGATTKGSACYFSLLKSDPIVKTGTYYVRYRALVDHGGVLKYGNWTGRALTL